MNITFDELREIKHRLPTGSVARIAKELDVDEQTVRNYFGANKFEDGEIVGRHIEPGPRGGIVHLEDTTILDLAKKFIKEKNTNQEDLLVGEEK
jgi:predicted transcriptional regulator